MGILFNIIDSPIKSPNFPAPNYVTTTSEANERRRSDIAEYDRRQVQRQRLAEATLVAATVAAREFVDEGDVYAVVAKALAQMRGEGGDD